jgi:hypothetical protein
MAAGLKAPMPDTLTLNEQVADDTVAHAIDLTSVEADLEEKALGSLEQLESILVQQLSAADLGSDGSPSLTPYARHRLEMLLQQTRDTIRTTYTAINAAHTVGLTDLANLASAFAEGVISPVALQIEIDTVALTAGQLRAIVSDALIQGAPSAEWWSRQAGDLVERFSDTMRMGLMQGWTNDQLVRAVRGTASWVGGRRVYNGGIMDITAQNAESLVRTSAQAVASASRRDTYRSNSDVVKGIVQISTLDNRTTLTCISYDREAWLFPDMQPIGTKRLPYNSGTPRHWRCRSTESGLLKSWRELGIDMNDLPVGERISSDGKVPADITFDEWLARRTPAQQDAQLGPGRAALWRNGKINLKQLLDGRGNPLTLEQLYAKYGRPK